MKNQQYFVKLGDKYLSALFEDKQNKAFGTTNKELAYCWDSKESAQKIADGYEGAIIEPKYAMGLFTSNTSWNEIMEWLDRNTDDQEDTKEFSRFILYLSKHKMTREFQKMLFLTDKCAIVQYINEFIQETGVMA